MPKAKKRGRGAKGDKEKPLLTLQGVLKLEKSFVTEQHEGAETVKVQLPGTEEPVELKLIPGQSEHDLVAYKAGYHVGPSNPFPQNEPEKEIFEQQKKVDELNQGFEELKKTSEEERKRREEQFKRAGMLPDHPPGEPTSTEAEEVKAVDPDAINPDNPKNYFLPESISKEPAFHNDKPLEFGVKLQDKMAPNTPEDDHKSQTNGNGITSADEIPSLEASNDGLDAMGQFDTNEEVPLMDTSLLPSMKPLPEEAQFGRDMVLDVALKMEEVRRKKRMERKKRLKDAEAAGVAPDPEDLDKEWEGVDDDMVYSLDEIQEQKKMEEELHRNQAQGPEISQTHMQQVRLSII